MNKKNLQKNAAGGSIKLNSKNWKTNKNKKAARGPACGELMRKMKLPIKTAQKTFKYFQDRAGSMAADFGASLERPIG